MSSPRTPTPDWGGWPAFRRIATLGLTVAFIAGCAEEPAPNEGQERATRELQEAQKQLRKERKRLERERREAPGGSQQSADGASSEDASSPNVGKGRVPNVKGKDLQFAQDTMQAAGFYSISEEDAAGEERIPLWDRGWRVLSQSPRPGTRASADRTIVLRVKKDGE
jgi:PASTA domain